MKEQRIQLWIALVGLAFGSFMLHFRIHPPADKLTNFWPTLFSSLDLVVVSVLFLFRSTAVWATILNGFMAYLGIIMMTDLTIESTFKGQISPLHQPFTWFSQSMFPDVAIAITDLMVGLALYRITMTQPKKK
jgi:hypothetical protein